MMTGAWMMRVEPKTALAALAMAVLMAGTGCSDDKDPDADDAGAAADVTDAGAAADTAEDSGPKADAGAADTETVRNPKCTNFKTNKLGTTVPWKGFTHKGTTYTCNVQRGGRADMQGTWRLVDGKTEDPRTPLKLEGQPYRETMAIDGNTFINKVSGVDLGKPVTATFSGWYWSADDAEIKGEPTIFVFTASEPKSAFGFDASSVYGATVLHDGVNRMGLFDMRFDDLHKVGKDSFLYCRVGTKVEVKVKGDKTELVACDSPFK